MDRCINVGKKLSTSTITSVYTCPSFYRSTVDVITLMNTSTSARTITLEWTDSSNSDTAYKIAKNKSVPAESYVHLGINLVLEAGDILKATASVSDSFELTLSVTEEYIPQA